MRADGEGTRAAGWVAAFPVAWLTIEIALDAWTISQAWRSAGIADIPHAIVYYLYGLIGGATVFLLWGLWVLSLAWSRAPAFPRAFIAWQTALIAWIVAGQAWAFSIQEFVFTAVSFLWPVAEIVIGLIAIAVAAGMARRPMPEAAEPAAAPTRLSGLGVALFAVLGVVVGAVVGAVGGAVLGSVIVELADISCFEGGCGYFAAAIALLGMIVCAIAGGVFAAMRANRRRLGA